MTPPKEMRSAVSWYNDASDSAAWVKSIQADALAWAAGQMQDSHSMEEAVLRLSLKHQELVKGKNDPVKGV